MRVKACIVVAAVAVSCLIPLPGLHAAGPSIDDVVRAQNEFAIALYWQLTRDQDRFVFSPFSISTVLAMALEGARGKTADEISRVASIPTDNSVRRASYAALSRSASGVNAIWTRKGSDRRYAETLRRHYSASRIDADFATRAWFIRRDINAWIDANTGLQLAALQAPRSRTTHIDAPSADRFVDHIPDYAFGSNLLDIGMHPVGLRASRRTLIVMFKDSATVADVNRTIASAGVEILGGMKGMRALLLGVADDGTFGPLDAALELLRKDPMVEAAAMNPVLSPDTNPPFEDQFGRIAIANVISVSRPFRSDFQQVYMGGFVMLERTTADGGLMFSMFTPQSGVFADVENRLTADALKQWKGTRGSPAVPARGDPEFLITARATLSATLTRMGMANTPQLMQVMSHRAAISVTSKGVEAAAATGAGSVVVDVEPGTSGGADVRPSVFVLQDVKTGLILFMGRAR